MTCSGTQRLLATIAAVGIGATVCAQVLDQNFNTVTGTGGGTFLVGPGFEDIHGWDTGIAGEAAFAGTTGNASFGSAAAYGAPTGGVNGSGAGVIDITNVTYNLLRETFDAVTGTGSAAFIVGNGTPNTSGYAPGWDDGIAGETAFAGTFNGAAFQTGGGATASGVTAGGQTGSGAGRIAVSGVALNGGNWYGGLTNRVGPFPGSVRLLNPSFEDGDLANWPEWGVGWNVVRGTSGVGAPLAHSGGYLLKFFGQFTGQPNTSGVYQDLAAQPGQTWQLGVFVHHMSSAVDTLQGRQNFVDMSIEFYDVGGTLLNSTTSIIMSSSTVPLDQWLAVTPLQLTAPAGTVRARAVFRFQQPAVGLYEGGAGFLDDASFRVVGGTHPVDLSALSLSAQYRGTINAGAGQTLGGVQLRIEDSDGNRLLFNQNANGNWQSIGGALSTATEANSSGVPTAGVFNKDSEYYNVVIAFNNELGGQPWNSGGTLTVDNFQLANNSPAGSAWYGGLFFDGLTMPRAQLDEIELSAAVKGTVPGGKYELRLEGFTLTSAGLDEHFANVTGTGGGHFLSYDDYLAGTTFQYTSNWDDGVSGEGAYGGIFGSTEIFAGGGFSATGLTADHAGEIRVEYILYNSGGGWYGGLNWINQGLASTDLSQVTLSAKIRGLEAGGGSLGKYELRIEDAQGDRLYFENFANGNWQNVGGPLSTATYGDSLGGGSNGAFDFDSPNYSVVVAFRDETSTWFFGGALQVDDLYLTPVDSAYEIGRASFTGVANGNWQNIGGLLSESDVTFGDHTQTFEAATSTGGGQILAGSGIVGGLPFDEGVTGETAFAGTWGTGAVTSVTAQACATCGVNGSKAAQLAVSGAVPGTNGGWWGGLAFPNLTLDLSDGLGDNLAALANKSLSAKVKATVNAGQGEAYGAYTLRLEDAQTDFLAFTLTGDGTWQTIGGPLSTAVRGQTPDGDGQFNYLQGAYSAVLVYEGGSTYGAWGTGGTLTLDDLFLTGINLDDADAFTVTVTFDDEIATWGNAGKLFVDDLYLGEAGPAFCLGDADCDGDVDFFDIDPFVAKLGCPGGAGCDAPCVWQNSDVDADGDVDFFDIDPFVARLGAMCP